MKVVAVIPVKKNSSRVKNKNIRLLGDKPLFIHMLDKLLSIKKINEVWIDTDSLEIIDIANNYNYKNFKYFIRDTIFSDNTTDGNLLLKNEIDNIEADIYLQVLCTSPFTSINSIIKCIDLLLSHKTNSVVGCFKEKLYLWKKGQANYNINNIPNSNTLDDTTIESMSLYGITKSEFNLTKKRIGSNPYFLELNNEEKIDINYEHDFVYAQKIAKLQVIEEYNYFNNLKIKLNSCIIADILNELGFSNNVLKDFKYNFNTKLFGRIRPIQIRKLNKNEDSNDIYKCLDSYNNISPGNIIFSCLGISESLF